MIKCIICGKEFTNKGFGKHLKKNHSITSEKYYFIYLKKEGEGICKHCKNKTIFLDFSRGYQKFCSLKCSNKSSETIQKIKDTFYIRYGTDNAMKVPEFKQKLKDSLNETIENSNNKIIEKRNKTMIKKYGVIGTLSVPEFKEKQENTCLEKYGETSYSKTDEYKENVSETNIKKFGTKCVFQNEQIKETIKETNLKKRGVPYVGMDFEVQKKMKETNLKERGVPYSIMDPKIIEKIKIKRDNFTEEKLEDIENKRQNTCFENSGYLYPMQSKEIKDKSRKTSLINFRIKVEKQLKDLNLEIINLTEFSYTMDNIKLRCLKCGREYDNRWYNIQLGYGKCPKCFPRSRNSTSQKEINEFINSLGFKTETDIPDLIKPYEIDIFCEDKGICIEFNGLYWHSEHFKSDDYHFQKYKLCKEKNLRLIQIFEDEWFNKKEICKEFLKSIFGISDKKIYARECEIKIINPKMKNDFLNDNHLLGQDTSVLKIGAFYNNELVSVMTFSHGNISRRKNTAGSGEWELSRFCNKLGIHIPGIASKLLKWFQRNFEWNKIYSYADLRWSNGNMYEKLGFEIVSITPPDYWYLDNKCYYRIHRFALRKKPDEPKNITEKELRLKEGYSRIYDCGKLKFEIVKSTENSPS